MDIVAFIAYGSKEHHNIGWNSRNELAKVAIDIQKWFEVTLLNEYKKAKNIECIEQ